MSSNQVLKKSLLGGFKKDGVLNYVEGLQAEIMNLRSKLESKSNSESEAVAALRNEIEQKETQIRDLESAIAANEEKDGEISALKAEIDHLNSVISDMSAERERLLAENEQALQAAKDEYEEKARLCEEKIAVIEDKFAQIESSYTRISETDSKVNAMMNNAILSSDKIISDAKAKSDEITSKANDALKDAFAEISDVYDQFRTATVNYDSSSAALKTRVESLIQLLESMQIELPDEE